MTPIVLGLVIGRVGCQLSGLWDQTSGNATRLPWGWNHGDGILRHPVAAYEIVCVVILFFSIRARWPDRPGPDTPRFSLNTARSDSGWSGSSRHSVHWRRVRSQWHSTVPSPPFNGPRSLASYGSGRCSGAA